MNKFWAGSFVARLGLLIVASSVLLGCGGGGGGGGSCGKVQPCGGSVVGTWKVASTCLTGAMLPVDTSFCPEAIFTPLDFQISGSYSYNADLTYSSALVVTAKFKAGLPPSCLMQGGITITCAQFDTLANANLIANPDPSIKSFACAMAGTGCECTIATNPTAQNETGTYTTSGSVLTTTPAGETASSDAYCVQGNVLHDIATAMDTGMGAVVGDLVLNKQ